MAQPDVGKALGAAHAECLQWNATAVLLTFAARAVSSESNPYQIWLILSTTEYQKLLHMTVSAVSSGVSQLLKDGYLEKKNVTLAGKARVVYRLTDRSETVVKALEGK